MTGLKYIVNGVILDTFNDDGALSYNYMIGEIEDPSKRSSNFTKSIRFPGTKKNNQLFTQISDLSKEIIGSEVDNYTIDFNPNKKVTCTVLKNEIQIFSGILQVVKVVVNDLDVIYECTILGSVINIIEQMSDKLISDLDFSEYDHEWTKTNIENSWDTEIVKDGSPLTNFSGGATTEFANGLPTGEGYVYPMIDYARSPSILEYRVTDFYPAIYLKTYIDKIIEEAGFTYDTDFWDDHPDWRQVIIPYDGKQTAFNDDEVTSRQFKAELTADDTQSNNFDYNKGRGLHFKDAFFNPVVFDDDSTGTNTDPSGIYDTGTGIYTVQKSGTYDLKASCLCYSKLTEPSGTNSAIIKIRFYVSILVNGIEITRQYYLEEFDYASSSPSFVEATQTVTAKLLNYELQTGDEVQVRALIKNEAAYYDFNNFFIKKKTSGTFDSEIRANSTFQNTVVKTSYSEGNLLNLNSFIPRDYSQRDFFKSFINHINAYVVPDETNPTNIIITPIKDFYRDNKTIDWTDKHDKSIVEIIPMSEVTAKSYKYNYVPDGDNWNELYTEEHIEVYGEKNYTVNNDFVKDTKEIETIFSPTVGVGNFDNAMVIPRLITIADDLITREKLDANIRMVYYGGVLNVGKNGTTANWYFNTVDETPEYKTVYPYCGHLDHPYTPSNDLNFGIVQEVYWGSPSDIGSNYTDNNLFNRFHRQYIEEITNKNSKQVTTYFHLTENDINQFKFPNFIFVQSLEGQIFRVLKILDYDPLNSSPTKVVLLKVSTRDAFTASVTQVGLTQTTTPGLANILEGGENEVRNAFATNPELYVEGGKDEVRNPFATNVELKVEGGNN